MAMPMMYGWNGDWGGMLLAMAVNAAVWIVVIGLLIWGVSKLITQSAQSARRPDAAPSALEILRQRYDRGELDEATFERMQSQLETSAARDALPALPGR